MAAEGDFSTILMEALLAESYEQAATVPNDDEDELLSQAILKAQYDSLMEYQWVPGQEQHRGQYATSSRRDVGNFSSGTKGLGSGEFTQHLQDMATNTLCQACFMIDVNATSKYPSTHHSRHALALVAASGCRMCQFFLKNIPDGNRLGSHRSAEVGVDLERSLMIYRSPDDSGGTRTFFELLPIPEQNSDLNSKLTFRAIDPDPISTRTLSVVRNWLSTCTSTHLACSSNLQFPLPTRVIDVSESEPRLLEANLANVPYITLSHCWGTASTLTTTRVTLKKHKALLPTSELPQSFRDAVRFTRTLGISYLWIDSICIIQDCEEDWRAECPKMGAYYKNSFLTLSALESPDSHSGFLTHRAVCDAIEVGESTGIRMRHRLKERSTIFKKAVLNTRGWALQERLLSTRVLHFTCQELFWECQTISTNEASEVEHKGQTDFQSLVSAEGDDFKRALQTRLDPDPYATNGAFSLWTRLVSQFSRRALTVSSDRLPAISSVAALIFEKTKSTYIAGIWKNDINGLAWFRDRPDYRIVHESSAATRGDYTAPSWSWASMRESVIYRFEDDKLIRSAKDPIIIDTDIQNLGSDPFGGVSRASITTQALTKSVQCLDHKRSPIGLVHGYAAAGWYHRLGKEVPEEEGSFDSLPLIIFSEDGTVVGTGVFDAHRNQQKLYRCKAIRIAQSRGTHSKRTEHNIAEQVVQDLVYFMLAEPAEGRPSCWKRVGMGITRNFVTRRTFLDPFDLWDWEDICLV